MHQIGQFRSLLGSYDEGTKWALYGRKPLAAETKIIQRTHPSALYTYPSQYEETPKLLVTGDLPVFEKAYNEYTNDYGYEGDWYHVRTPRGEGWFNPTYAELEDATVETATIQLHMDVTRLYRYPNTSISLENGQLGPQTLRPLAAWTAPVGIRWYQINTFVGKAWIQLELARDRLVLKDRESDMQIDSGYYNQGRATYKNEGVYTFGGQNTGFELQGKPFFNIDFLAHLLRHPLYTLSILQSS